MTTNPKDKKEKDPLAVALGKRGGIATKLKHGPEYFKEIRKQRKTYTKREDTNRK